MLYIFNIYKTFFIPHLDKLSICHIEKHIFYIRGMENLSTFGIDKTFMSILGIEKLSIFDTYINCFVYIMYRQYVYIWYRQSQIL